MHSFSIHVQHLSKHYGTHTVFHDISFNHSGGVLGIAGPNGSGKSTLLQCLAHLKRPSSGTIAWKKEAQRVKNEIMRAHLGYAAPYINLYDELSCAENLRFLLSLRGSTHKDETAKKALQKTGMAPLAGQPFGKLSTGQQQRLRLAAALVHQPDVLCLDEPGANLDKEGRKLIQSLVSAFKEAGKLVIIASNNPEELELCDAIYSVEQEDFISG